MREALQSVLAPIHPAGWPFLAVAGLATLLLAWLWLPLGVLGLVLTLWMAYFFRDPARVTPTRSGLVVSPADGRVQMIVDAPPPPELAMGADPRPRISIFLNVFDVHINRVPIDGTVAAVVYNPGKFVNAALDKASEANERTAVRVVTGGRHDDIAFVQIAGLIARRIICNLKAGDIVRAGERYGLIRFGSRVDVYLPPGVAPMVVVGQRALGGETVLADLNSNEAPRQGEVR